jgi:hypothetical protein
MWGVVVGMKVDLLFVIKAQILSACASLMGVCDWRLKSGENRIPTSSDYFQPAIRTHAI